MSAFEGQSLRLKTKTFGGKIFQKLHSISPYNIFVTKIKEVTLRKFSIAKKIPKVACNRKSHQKLHHHLARKMQF